MCKLLKPLFIFSAALFSFSDSQALTCQEVFLESSKLSQLNSSPLQSLNESIHGIIIRTRDLPVGVFEAEKPLEEALRSKVMAENVQEAVESREEEQMIITFSGASHSFHYFSALGPRNDSVFLSPRISEIDQNTEFADFSRRLAKLPPNEKGFFDQMTRNLLSMDADINSWFLENLMKVFSDKDTQYSSALFSQSIAELSSEVIRYHSTKNGRQDVNLSSKVPEPPRVFHIADFHYFPSTQFLKDLPSSKDLHKDGVKEIVVLMESFYPKQVISIDLIREASRLYLSSYLQHFPFLQRLTYRLMGRSPSVKESDVIKNLEEGLVINPIANELANILDTYKRDGVKITIKGMNFNDNGESREIFLQH